MPPTWGQVRQFCLRQGYRETRTDHFHYLKVLPDRSTSGTMVSMGADSDEVPSQLWRLVWSRQLRLASEDDFWSGLRGDPVAYAIPPVLEPPVSLPDYLERFLRDTLHLPDSEIATFTRAQAQELLNQYYSRELQDP